MKKPKDDIEETEAPDQGSKDDDAAPTPVSDVEAYESEWYEVLKRRSEELAAEGEEAVDGDDNDEG